MNERRFDAWVRSLAAQRGGTRRHLLRGLLGTGALLAAANRGERGVAAHHGSSGPGEPCRDTRQCVGADAPLVCAWNGLNHDGTLNCCTDLGNNCGSDAACCDVALCIGGVCTSGPPAECTWQGCSCWQAPGQPNPCDWDLVCCSGSDNVGICVGGDACTGFGAPGDECLVSCAAGAECWICLSGFCTLSGYCA